MVYIATRNAELSYRYFTCASRGCLPLSERSEWNAFTNIEVEIFQTFKNVASTLFDFHIVLILNELIIQFGRLCQFLRITKFKPAYLISIAVFYTHSLTITSI